MTPRITLLVVLSATLILLLILATYDFDRQAMTSIFYQVEGFETSLEVDNSSKIADIYNRLNIQNANISQLKNRMDENQPLINSMRKREETVQKDTAEASVALSSDLNRIMTKNMNLNEKEVSDFAVDQEKQQIITKAQLLQDERNLLNAQVEGFESYDYAPYPEVEEAISKFITDSTANMIKEDREYIMKRAREDNIIQ